MSGDSISSDFFVAGGTLRPDSPSYVKRPADDELFHLAVAGEFCYVLTPRQMGKSSLMVQTARRLERRGVNTVLIDLTKIGTVAIDQWYLGLLTRLKRGLGLTANPETWWRERELLGQVQRFTDFLRDVVLDEIEGPVVIFIDEIDTTLRLDFRDDFFAAIRAMYNNRADDPELERLTFVLLGVASPPDLIKDRTRTPFNIGQGITLGDFSRTDAAVLREGLEKVYPGQGEAIFSRIYHWTNGHPYLTQKLCQATVKAGNGPWPGERIDILVQNQLLAKEASKESNLKFVQDRILTYPQKHQLLDVYRKVLNKRKNVVDVEQSPLHNQLKLSGLVKAEDGYLQVRNAIYRHVFNSDWIRANTPVNRTPILIVVTGIAIIIALLAITVIAYNAQVRTQVLACRSNFYDANAPEEQVACLAGLFRPQGFFFGPTDYGYTARELFYGLSREEQLNLFAVDNVDEADLITLIQNLYITLADVDGTDNTRPLLEAMAGALDDRYDTQETKRLRNEIYGWLKGREFAKQNNYYAAVYAYNKAIELNNDNPATLYERARILIALPDYQLALNDLDSVVVIARRMLAPTPTPTPPAERSETPISTSTVRPTTPLGPIPPTPTPSPSVTLAGTSTSSATTGLTKTRSITWTATSTLTPPPAETPLSTPTTIPASIISEFASTGQMLNAVRNLIYSDLALISYLAEAPNSEYPNLRESGLVPTPTATPLPFAYQVQIQAADTSEFISNASVTIEVSGKPSLDAITDSTGFARIFVGSSYTGQPALLIFEATGYEKYSQHIDLLEDALPDVVQLEPVALAGPTTTPPMAATSTEAQASTPTLTPSPGPTLAPMSTLSTATFLPTPTSAWMPTVTPTAVPIEDTITPLVTPTPSPTEPPTATPTPALVVYVQSGGQTHTLGMVRSSSAPVPNGITLDLAAAPAWSPNGRQIAFFGEPGIDTKYPSDFGEGEGVWTLSYPPGKPTLLYATDHVKNVAWSPNGTYLALELNPPGQQANAVVIRASDGQELHRFDGQQPAWESDGDKLIIKTQPPGESCGLWQVALNGNLKHQITTDCTDSYPVTSPDNNYLAFSSERSGNWDIYLIELPNGDPRRITSEAGTDTTPVFSLDGHKIFYRSNSFRPDWQIVVMNLDGSNKVSVRNGIGPSDDHGLARPAVY